ncbi:MAG: hypothetical protein ACXV5K_10150 [Halobacteriota archaeon]
MTHGVSGTDWIHYKHPLPDTRMTAICGIGEMSNSHSKIALSGRLNPFLTEFIRWNSSRHVFFGNQNALNGGQNPPKENEQAIKQATHFAAA